MFSFCSKCQDWRPFLVRVWLIAGARETLQLGVPWIFAWLVWALLAVPAASAQNCTVVGRDIFCDDGVSGRRIGSTTFWNDGSSSLRSGNRTFNSDGSSAIQSGNTTFFNDGTSAVRSGNTVFFDNGRNCSRTGNFIFCN
jgi:hypothetical protein